MEIFSWSALSRPFTCLAPMEDVTDTVFRRIVAEVAPPDVFFTEFTSADGLQSPGRDEVATRLEFTEAERPIIAQIWGADPENFYRTATELVQRGFDGIDINMGCPVEKITKKGCCGALCRDHGRASEMIHATVAGAAELPVSVKTRIGYDAPDTETWCGFLLDHPIAALTLHGRTVVQQSEGPADWREIAAAVRLRDASPSDAAIIGNGDVRERRQLSDQPRRWGVDGVMVGRGIFHDLYIFDRTGTLPHYQALPLRSKLDALTRHVSLYEQVWDGQRNFHILKKFVKTYIAGFDGAASLRNQMMRATDYAELYEAIRGVELQSDLAEG